MSDIYEHDQMIVLGTFLANVVVVIILILILLIIIIKLGSDTNWFFSLKVKY